MVVCNVSSFILLILLVVVMTDFLSSISTDGGALTLVTVAG